MVNPPYPARKFFEGFAPVVVLLMELGGAFRLGRSGFGDCQNGDTLLLSQVLPLRINIGAYDSGNYIPPRDFGQEFGSPYHAFDVAVAGRDRDLGSEIHLWLIRISSAGSRRSQSG